MAQGIKGRKVAIVGCGFVGATSAFALMESGLFSEMVLIDVDQDRAEGEALDISHGIAFARPMDIHAGTYADAADADVIIVTAGAAQKPGETRLDLVNKNVAIFSGIMAQIRESGFSGILLIVSNPVDVLTYAAFRVGHDEQDAPKGPGGDLGDDGVENVHVLADELQAGLARLLVGPGGNDDEGAVGQVVVGPGVHVHGGDIGQAVAEVHGLALRLVPVGVDEH